MSKNSHTNLSHYMNLSNSVNAAAQANSHTQERIIPADTYKQKKLYSDRADKGNRRAYLIEDKFLLNSF